MNIRSKARLFATGTLLLIALVGLGLSKLLQRRTRTWPKTSATIDSAKMEIMELDAKTDIVLPCFAFSYVASGENHSGRFSLFTDEQEEGESMARKMIRRTIEIQYNPRRPSIWYIPEKMIDGYEVEQKMFPRRTLYPKD
ncbi:MAG TPA: hypothetical protein VMQ56_07465 [Terracidiphilus sp.]|nr:hypothetical protein [Terracidiphilus sp.]